jgi:hypothetical protein
MFEIPESWLELINRKMSAEGVPYIQRPFRALLDWTREHKIAIRHDSETAKKVFEWFYRNSPQAAHFVGALYTGLFYYDVYFWPVAIPIAYGTVSLDPFTSLNTMPETIKSQMRIDRAVWIEYISLWADCVDYGFGRDDIAKIGLPGSFAQELLASADYQLDATVSTLREKHPNSGAMESARMATEMFLKAFLAAHDGLSESGAIDIRHNLNTALGMAVKVRGGSELARLQNRISRFADVSARYRGIIYDPTELWFANATAQFAGSAVVRSLTDRDARRSMEQKLAKGSSGSS